MFNVASTLFGNPILLLPRSDGNVQMFSCFCPVLWLYKLGSYY